jgi:hypothetical protein
MKLAPAIVGCKGGRQGHKSRTEGIKRDNAEEKEWEGERTLTASNLNPQAPTSLMIHLPHLMMSSRASGWLWSISAPTKSIENKQC